MPLQFSVAHGSLARIALMSSDKRNRAVRGNSSFPKNRRYTYLIDVRLSRIQSRYLSRMDSKSSIK